VPVELEQIKSEIPSTTELLNQRFTLKGLESKINKTAYPLVHLATHGQFSSQQEQTFLLAWDQLIFASDLNDLLQNSETTSHTPLELLVLSACQTAVGDKRAALGLAGIALRAGARSTVASLWSINDQSTTLMMSRFYTSLAFEHLTKAGALRQSQIALLQNPRYNRPYYWASYVLVGNWL
jgi:CHAT domain-containing protein